MVDSSTWESLFSFQVPNVNYENFISWWNDIIFGRFFVETVATGKMFDLEK
jgi:hypothetical protein